MEEAIVLQIVRDALGCPVGPDDDMFDHGASSLTFVRVLAELNRRFHVVVDVADLDGAATAAALAACVARGSSRPLAQTTGG